MIQIELFPGEARLYLDWLDAMAKTGATATHQAAASIIRDRLREAMPKQPPVVIMAELVAAE